MDAKSVADPAAVTPLAVALPLSQAAVSAFQAGMRQAPQAAIAAVRTWLDFFEMAQRGKAPTAQQRIEATAAIREAHAAMHALADQLVAAAAALDRVAGAYVAAVQQMPTAGEA